MAGVVEEEAAAVGVQAANPNVLLTEVSAPESPAGGASAETLHFNAQASLYLPCLTRHFSSTSVLILP